MDRKKRGKSLRIALVTETFLPSTDGIVTRLCAAVRWLREAGHEVLIIAPDMGVDEYEGARVAGIKPRSFFLYKDRNWAYPSFKVKKYLSEFDPDLVHVVNPALLGVSGIYYSRRAGYPLIASYHTHLPVYADYYNVSFIKPVLWAYFRILHNRADLNLCTSKTIQKELTEHKIKQVELWDRGVDTEKFHPDKYSGEMRDRLTQGHPDQKLLLYVGRLAAEKEIEQIRHVLDQRPDFSLAVVGDGPHREEIEDHFKGSNTVFTGFLHGDELSAAYASSDIFVFPSTTETLGLVLLEAMAAGLPVVAAKSGPTLEQVDDGVTGALFEPRSTESFVNAILSLEDTEKRRTMAEKARAASEALGWDKPSAQLYDYYKQVLQWKEQEAKHGTRPNRLE